MPLPTAIKVVVAIVFALVMWGVSWFMHDVFGPRWSALVDRMPAPLVFALSALGLAGFAVMHCVARASGRGVDLTKLSGGGIMKNFAVMALAGGLFAGSTIAIAQEASGYPDMRGRWKGTNEGVVLGSGMYHREGGKAEPRTVNKEFTLDIKGQDGRRFWGEIVSKDDTGPFLGVISNDKQTVYYVDNAGGHVAGKLTGSGQFEICYLRPSKDIMVAACNIFIKQ